MKRPSLRTTMLLMLFSCATPAALMAQASTGSMSGTVTDPNGAAVPAAKVIASSAASGIKVETLTSDAGLYVFPRLPVGVYEIAVDMSDLKDPNHHGMQHRSA